MHINGFFIFYFSKLNTFFSPFLTHKNHKRQKLGKKENKTGTYQLVTTIPKTNKNHVIHFNEKKKKKTGEGGRKEV